MPCGTTGETPTLGPGEQAELIKKTVELAKGKATVLAGTGSNGTQKTIDASRTALEAGADAVMIVMPYYNKPSQAGLVHHVELVAKAVEAPVVLYNIPGRCMVNLAVESVLRILDSCSNVVGLKDATNNVLHCQKLLAKAGDRISVVSGDDGLTLPLMSVGAKGIISVTGNVLPKPVVEVVKLVDKGYWEDARELHLSLLDVHAAMFKEPNPAPAKAVLAARGMMNATVRPPLVAASDGAREAALQAIQAFEES